MSDPVVDFFRLAVAVSVTYILGGEGMTIAGKSGIFLVFNEGVMLASASATFLVASMSGGNIVLGLMTGALMGGLFGLVMGYFSITLKQNQFVVGLALLVAAVGIANFLYSVFVGVVIKPPQVPTLQAVNIPILSQIPYVGPVLFSQNAMLYFAVALSVAIWYFLHKTRYGLHYRSVGENPRVADSLGINVTLVRYAGAVAGGAILGLAGGYLPLYFTGTYTSALVNGRGWIIIALTLFGRWSPLPVMLGAFLFATAEVFGIYGQILNLPVPSQFLLMVPFLVTLLILVQTYRKTELPEGLAKNYDREKIED